MSKYSLSSQQQHVLDLWNHGDNIRVIAVAGAGKSTVILEICEHTTEPVCIITYNKPLQEELRDKLNAINSTSVAYTFHGLASEYCSNCRDDTTLSDIVTTITPKPFLYKNVIIDESQDMKQVYFDFLHLLIPDFSSVQIGLVGDPEQMLYDYDPDDPAILGFINDPDTHFGVPFSKGELSVSFRLTPCITHLSNALSIKDSVQIVPGNTKVTNEKVDVQICSKSLWSDIAINWILKHHPITFPGTIHILAAHRRKNVEIRQLVNALARYGYGIYVHIDDCIENKKFSNVHVMSWHSSKGSESETTVILGMGASSAQNPLHVAITRSKHRLLVLAERENIHLPFAKLVVESPDYLNLIDTQRTIESAQFAIDSSIETERNRKKPEGDIENEEIPARDRTPNINPPHKIVSNKSHWEPLGREYRVSGHLQLFGTEYLVTPDQIPVDHETIIGNFHGATAIHYLTYAMIRNEYAHTGKVRMYDFIKAPIPTAKRKRRYLENIHDLPAKGSREYDLLPGFAQKLLKTKYTSLFELTGISEWMTLAVLLNSWQRFHNKTQMQIPVENWISDGIAITMERTLHEAVPDNITDYNGHVSFTRSETLTYKAKYFARGNGIIYQCIFDDDISYQTKARLSLPAIFAREKLKIINLKKGIVSIYEFPMDPVKTLELLKL